MHSSEYQNIYKHEESHFYYQSLHRLIINYISRYAPKRTLKLLDAGCGTGLLAKKLATFGEVYAIDIQQRAVDFAKKRSVRAEKSSITKLPFKSGYFDVITCIDVLYHKSVKDENAALSELYRVLKKGGVLIVRVPANKWLSSPHDTLVHTRKRFEKKELINLLEGAGFKVLQNSYINLLLLLPYLIKNVSKDSSKEQSYIYNVNPLINNLLTYLLNLENKAVINISLPLGLGLIAVAKKVS